MEHIEECKITEEMINKNDYICWYLGVTEDEGLRSLSWTNSLVMLMLLVHGPRLEQESNNA